MFVGANVIHADCDHTTRGPTNRFLHNIRVNFPSFLISDNSALALIAEGGYQNNYRVNATYGIIFDPCNRLKVSGEYLQQHLSYNFVSGRKNRWMGQFAVGGAYEYSLLNLPYLQSIDLSGYYSRAGSKGNFRIHNCDITSAGQTHVHRRLAGANAFNASAGATLTPWCDALLHVAADYDYVKYRRRLNSRRIVSGVGASVELKQRFCREFEVVLNGEFRRPYDYYGWEVNWTPCTKIGNFLIGIFGGHTHGKERLPNNTVTGIHFNFFWFGRFGTSFVPYNPNLTYCCSSPCFDSCGILAWVAEPAVYMPEVLAIADEQIFKNQCVGPTSTAIADTFVTTTGPTVLSDIGSSFTNPLGGPITFSAVGLPNGGGTTSTIDPNTGTITVNNSGNSDATFRVTVTGTTRCGSTSQSFNITIITL